MCSNFFSLHIYEDDSILDPWPVRLSSDMKCRDQTWEDRGIVIIFFVFFCFGFDLCSSSFAYHMQIVIISSLITYTIYKYTITSIFISCPVTFLFKWEMELCLHVIESNFEHQIAANTSLKVQHICQKIYNCGEIALCLKVLANLLAY